MAADLPLPGGVSDGPAPTNNQGRAKLNGHRQYIEQHITALGCETGKGMTVVDQFDSMIFFSELVWVGTKEANPNEVPLPFPQPIFGKGKLGGSGGESGASASASNPTSTSAASASKVSEEEHAGDTGPAEEDEDEAAAPSRKSGRASSSVRKVYVEVDSDAAVDDDISSVRRLSQMRVQLMRLWGS